MKKLFTAVVFFLSLAFYAKASDLPRKEYPRPQFERESWINLMVHGLSTLTLDSLESTDNIKVQRNSVKTLQYLFVRKVNCRESNIPIL